MKEPVRFEGRDGTFMWVEVESSAGSDVGLVVKEGAPQQALTRLEDSLASVRGAATALMATVRDMPKGPDEVTLEIALSFAIEGGMIVAKGSAKAEASVTLTWNNPAAEATVAGVPESEGKAM